MHAKFNTIWPLKPCAAQHSCTQSHWIISSTRDHTHLIVSRVICKLLPFIFVEHMLWGSESNVKCVAPFQRCHIINAGRHIYTVIVSFWMVSFGIELDKMTILCYVIVLELHARKKCKHKKNKFFLRQNKRWILFQTNYVCGKIIL